MLASGQLLAVLQPGGDQRQDGAVSPLTGVGNRALRRLQDAMTLTLTSITSSFPRSLIGPCSRIREAHGELSAGAQQPWGRHIRREDGLADLAGQETLDNEINPLRRVAQGTGHG